MSAFSIDPRTTDAADAMQQMLALEIAIGCSLPNDVTCWPTGLVNAWNDAAESGAFRQTATIGDMARAFLQHRAARFDPPATLRKPKETNA
jgi:hypothetical protein